MHKLSINTGFAVNRYIEPEDYIALIGDTFGVKYIQLTADLISPSLPSSLVLNHVNRVNKACAKYNVTISSVFTGAFTRVNHFSHPDEEFRKFWLGWLKSLIDVSSDVGATAMGSHLGILSVKDNSNSQKRSERLEQTINCWHLLADYGKEKNIKYLMWEPMSISREYGETLDEAKKIQSMLSGTEIPVKMCLDVDHGDVTSANPSDTDPYQWIERFANESGAIHLKQSLKDKGGHWPFIEEYNKNGNIEPGKIIHAFNQKNVEEMEFVLELSFREREPTDSLVEKNMKASVDFWRQWIKN